MVMALSWKSLKLKLDKFKSFTATSSDSFELPLDSVEVYLHVLVAPPLSHCKEQLQVRYACLSLWHSPRLMLGYCGKEDAGIDWSDPAEVSLYHLFFGAASF